jgi:hypothetical protein
MSREGARHGHEVAAAAADEVEEVGGKVHVDVDADGEDEERK